MAALTRPLTSEERRTFELYRRAAGRLHERVDPFARHQFKVRILRWDQPDDADLIHDSDFIALLTAFRLFYATMERTHFGRIANIAYKVGDDEARRLVATFRASWKEIPARPFAFAIHEEHFRPSSMLDTWINGEVFHQDEELVTRVDRLKDGGVFAVMVLQLTVRDMCFPILGLDNVIAMLLEQPLRRLPGEPPAVLGEPLSTNDSFRLSGE